jgi:DNA primase
MQPKYLRPGFRKKGGAMFGEHMFEPAPYVNLVEGELDAIWLWQNGYHSTLAFCGLPTKEQMKACVSFGNNFRLCFDNDKAGKGYAEKMGAILSENQLHYCSIELPEGVKDVQELPSENLKQIMRRSR